MSNFWQDKRVLVTGGAGFIGRFVIENLVQRRGMDPQNIVVPRSSGGDLREAKNCRKVVEGCQVVIHLAARTGGIAFSRYHPASQYVDCMLMSLNLLEASRLANVEKFVGLGNLLVYSTSAPSPLEEASLHEGKVAGTHLGIGTAKRDLVLMAEMFHKEYSLNSVCVLSANAYGPGDRFDQQVSHVIPATIAKCHQEGPLIVWGDGKPTRDFLFVEDIAEGILLAAEKLNSPDYYLNIASGDEISIGDLVRLIARLCDFKGEIVFDTSKAGGDPRRCASGEKARQLLGFTPQVNLEQGLRRTIAWYRDRLSSGIY